MTPRAGSTREPAPAIPLPPLAELSIIRRQDRDRSEAESAAPSAPAEWTAFRDVDVSAVVGRLRGSDAEVRVRDAVTARVGDRATVTHSGASGLDSAQTHASPTPSIDVGRVQRRPIVVETEDGAVAISTASVVRLSARAPLSSTLSLDAFAQLCADMESADVK